MESTHTTTQRKACVHMPHHIHLAHSILWWRTRTETRILKGIKKKKEESKATFLNILYNHSG